MNKTELNSCYTACKDLLFQLGFMPSDKTLKEMISCIDIPEPDVLMLKEPIDAAPWMPSFQNLINAMKYKDDSHTKPSDFYAAAQEMDRVHTKTSHGYLSSGPNMFARALNIYVAVKLEKEGKQYHFTEFENCNCIWYSGYYKTHPHGEEAEKLSNLFDKLIDDLKEKGIICELTMPAKTNMKEVKAIVANRREQRSSSDSKVAQYNNIRDVGRRISQP